jgi:uncharacterized protein YkwD
VRQARRTLATALVMAALMAVYSALPTAHLAAVPVASASWLERLNSWRASSGLSTLTENPTWSAGDYNHAVYMVKNNLVTHYETPGTAYYTTAGDVAAQNSNIEVSGSTSTTDEQAIDWWMGAPFHAMGMMDPRLATTGYGAYRNAASTPWQAGFAVDTIRGNTFTGGKYPVYWPGNGATEPLVTYSGYEWPDPLQACPGYSMPTGLPVFVEIGGNVQTTAGAHSFTTNGVALDHCIIDANNTAVGSYLKERGGVIVIPRNPLKNGSKYTVALTVNAVPYTWSFTVGALISIPVAPLAIGATAGDATAMVTWNPPAYDGGTAITSYTVTPYTASGAQASQIVVAPTTTASFNGLSDGTPYWFTVAATNSVGTGVTASSYSVTPTSNAVPVARMTAFSPVQRTLPNSDGITWQDVDATNLSLSVTPTANSLAIVTANADLWTANAGYNQDLGIWMSPSTAPAGIIAWKEAGGFAGTFSPNAAAIQTVVALTANTTYSLKLRWKTNRPALGASIYASAGPLPGGGGNSPASLVVQLVPPGSVATGASNQQYSLADSDGVTWKAIDATKLVASLTPTTSSTAVLSGNADLWTAKAGYNQDIGIFVSVNGGPDQLVAWKESGGFAGTFSPNAAFVQGLYSMTAGSTYVFKLEWKANRSAIGATIYAGAGPIGGLYSPTQLTAQLASSTSALGAAARQQYSLAGSDGATWVEIDKANLEVNLAVSSNASVLLVGNADLWTANAGYNQDVGIFVSVNGGADQLLTWVESGGFAGTYSPNAAYMQTTYNMNAGSAYVFKLKWKTNRNSTAATIFAGAGPIGGLYSPTTLTAQVMS